MRNRAGANDVDCKIRPNRPLRFPQLLARLFCGMFDFCIDANQADVRIGGMSQTQPQTKGEAMTTKQQCLLTRFRRQWEAEGRRTYDSVEVNVVDATGCGLRGSDSTVTLFVSVRFIFDSGKASAWKCRSLRIGPRGGLRMETEEW